ncbi:hypothetical protein ACLKA6_006015 [Drosophila palustris]
MGGVDPMDGLIGRYHIRIEDQEVDKPDFFSSIGYGHGKRVWGKVGAGGGQTASHGECGVFPATACHGNLPVATFFGLRSRCTLRCAVVPVCGGSRRRIRIRDRVRVQLPMHIRMSPVFFLTSTIGLAARWGHRRPLRSCGSGSGGIAMAQTSGRLDQLAIFSGPHKLVLVEQVSSVVFVSHVARLPGLES